MSLVGAQRSKDSAKFSIGIQVFQSIIYQARGTCIYSVSSVIHANYSVRGFSHELSPSGIESLTCWQAIGNALRFERPPIASLFGLRTEEEFAPLASQS